MPPYARNTSIAPAEPGTKSSGLTGDPFFNSQYAAGYAAGRRDALNEAEPIAADIADWMDGQNGVVAAQTVRDRFHGLRENLTIPMSC